MSRVIMLIPTEMNVGLTSVILGMRHAMTRQGINVSLFKPVVTQHPGLEKAAPESLTIDDVETLIGSEQQAVLMEEIIARFQTISKQAKIVLVEGLGPTNAYPFINQLNYDFAKTLGAEIIFVSALTHYSTEQFARRIKIIRTNFGGRKNDKITGVIVNKVNAPIDNQIVKNPDAPESCRDYLSNSHIITAKVLRKIMPLPLLGTVPYFNLKSAIHDKKRIAEVESLIAEHIDSSWIISLKKEEANDGRLSPPAFRYQITQLASKAKKTVVLPEGEEPRTIQAAAICSERCIARCVLLGNREKIESMAIEQGVKLVEGVEIIDPEKRREKYVKRLVELRRSKGMTEIMAREQLSDNVVLATMMLERDEVDGLVSGAVHTTANTIRPPLQIIKMKSGCSLVSSVFFMLMPEQVYVYGDCAINPNPTASQLAEIAIQSADTAAAFGIKPRVAMLSYSTGNSGQGEDVEKVREATQIAKARRPDLVLDGPLQYDASVAPDVARSKAENSPVAGRANVFIFPDLDTGNITYKAVQRAADIVSIGPMLQGMRKPVNDLSRGASVDDIVYTIALTAIQATQQ